MRARVVPLVAVIALATPGLRANVAAPPTPGSLSSPIARDKTPLEVLDEKLRFECADEGRDLRCKFVATYRIHNPTSEAIKQPAAFTTVRAKDVDVTVDGAPVETDLSPGERIALGSTTHERLVSEFRVTVAAGGTRTLTVRGSIDLVARRTGTAYEVPAGVVRHLMFGNSPGERHSTLDYFIAPIRTWSGDPTIDVELIAPARYDLFGPLQKVNETTWRFSTRASSAPHFLQVTFIERGRPVYGGVLLGIGGSAGDEKGLRLRAGAEVALASLPWLLASVSYENNVGRDYIVPVLKAASPHIIILPSVGIGVGAPVQVAPITRVGARLEMDVHLGPLGFVFDLDGYPATSTVQTSFMFQLSL